MEALAVVIQAPEELAVRRIGLTEPGPADVVVELEWSGISTGTERLLWTGRMPPFPGLSYPLVPGYESVGRISRVGPAAKGAQVGDRVFVPGARCFVGVQGLFGGAASRLVVPADRVTKLDAKLGEEGILLALAATAQHALVGGDREAPDLIVGHGVLGRLLARLAIAMGGAPTVWETHPVRKSGAVGYSVIDPSEDTRKDYRRIYDVSGDSRLLETLIGRLARCGEIVLAGFYSEPLSFAFAPAFIKEARIRVAAEWAPPDLVQVLELLATDKLSLAGLITHRHEVDQANDAYRTAFGDPSCLKMLLDWRSCS